MIYSNPDSCPADRNKIAEQNLLKPLQPFINLLNNLEIHFFSNKGCKKYLKLGELEYHVDSCNFNPNLNIFCDCGLKLETINSTDHKNNCIHHLKKQLNGSLDII